MEEEKKLPKNIRQMAEKEERVRVYLEDYAYTFIRKLNCTGHVRTGILLGSKMVTENVSLNTCFDRVCISKNNTSSFRL